MDWLSFSLGWMGASLVIGLVADAWFRSRECKAAVDSGLTANCSKHPLYPTPNEARTGLEDRIHELGCQSLTEAHNTGVRNDSKALLDLQEKYEEQLVEFILSQRQAALDSPMGVTKWLKHGKKYGYLDFAMLEVKLEAVEEFASILKQWNGSYIGIGGRRVDNMIHHQVIDEQLECYKTNLTQEFNKNASS